MNKKNEMESEARLLLPVACRISHDHYPKAAFRIPREEVNVLHYEAVYHLLRAKNVETKLHKSLLTWPNSQIKELGI